MLFRCTVVQLLTAGLVVSAVSANIWDNLFSQYSSPLVPLTAPMSMKFELQQFTMLLPVFLRVDYYGPQNAISLTLGRENTDVGVVTIDFKHGFLRIKAEQNAAVTPKLGTCVYRTLPTALRGDITDLNNLLRYFAYEEKGSNPYTDIKTYRLNLLGLQQNLLPFTNSSLPKFQIKLKKNSKNEFTSIDLVLGETELNLKRSAGDLKTNQPPKPLETLDTNSCVEGQTLSQLDTVRTAIFENLLGEQLALLRGLFPDWMPK